MHIYLVPSLPCWWEKVAARQLLVPPYAEKPFMSYVVGGTARNVSAPPVNAWKSAVSAVLVASSQLFSLWLSPHDVKSL